MKRVLLFAFGFLLIVDGLWLLSLDKIHLGIVLPIFIGLIFMMTAIFYGAIQRFLAQHPKLHSFWRVSWASFWLWLISLAGFFAYLQYSSQQSASIPKVRAIIVLGSGIENGQPSPTLKARLDAAVPAAQQNPQAAIIMTGGYGRHEKVSEAAVMWQYMLQAHHLPAQRIYLEDQSTSTALNLANSKAVLAQLHIRADQPVAIVSSDFHLSRAAAIAKHEGYSHIYTISAPTPLYIRYNSWLREYFAFLSGWLLNEY
jgi:uncharacterized SAM-binding protein YcdF (DUF218 family)